MAVASLVLTAIYGAIIVSVVLMLFLKRRPRNDEPPILPYWIPYIGSGLEFRKDPGTFMRRNHKKYGPIFTAYMAGNYYHFISDPFTYASVAKEQKRLCFHEFLTEVIKKTFDVVRRPFHGIFQKHLQGFLEARQRSWNFFSVENIQEREDTSPLIAELIENISSEGFANVDTTKHVYGVLWAAAAATNTAVFWAIYFVITHPEALKAAEKEIVEMLEKTGQVGTKELKFTRAELEEMKVLNSIAYEAMRMTVSTGSRSQATEDLELKIAALSETRHIREGDIVMVAFQHLHFDEEVYPEPHKFKYDRFLNEDGTEKTDFYKNGKKLHQYVESFGMGKSKCPGRHWVITELKQAIIIFLTYVEFQLTDPNKEIFTKPDRFMMGTLAPSEDPIIRYRRK